MSNLGSQTPSSAISLPM